MLCTVTPPLDDAAMDTFEQDGYFIARELFAPDEVRLLVDTFMDINRDGPVAGLSETSSGFGKYDLSDPLSFYPRMMHPHRHMDKPVGPLARRYMLDARVGEVLWQLMGEEPVACQSMFYFKPPGARGQAAHQDNFYLQVKPGTCMAAWTALDDADESNGGLFVIPGTGNHSIECPAKADPKIYFTGHFVPTPAGKKEQPLHLKAGDVLFFNGNVIHGSHPNNSNRFRRSFICHYAPVSALELSKYYQEPTRFDGSLVEYLLPSDAGGPCGEFVSAIKSAH